MPGDGHKHANEEPKDMDIGMYGLGRMGGNMARRLLQDGHRVVVANRDPEPVHELAAEGAVPSESLVQLVEQLKAPRAVWVMVPAGEPTETSVNRIADLLDAGDTIVDGGNSNYKDSMRRAGELAERGINFVDAGTSGGIWGLAEGYSLMVGGPDAAIAHITPALKTLAPSSDSGWGHVGPSGAGHFVKMVHNGIEYGMMQAFAEGFSILKHKEELGLDLHQVAQVWQHGSVVRSWLLDLAANALEEDGDLSEIAPWVSDSGEGRWTVFEAIDLDVPAPVITMSLMARFRSRDEESFADRMLAALRNQFGGHAVKKGS